MGSGQGVSLSQLGAPSSRSSRCSATQLARVEEVVRDVHAAVAQLVGGAGQRDGLARRQEGDGLVEAQPRRRSPRRPSAGPGGKRRAPDGSGRREGDRDVLGAVDEIGLQALHIAVEPDVGDPSEQPVEHHHDLHPSEVRTEAEVGPASAEGDVVVRRAGDVEGVGVLEGVLVTVGRGVPEHDLVALLDLLATHLQVRRRRAAEVHDRRDIAQHLLDGARKERAVGAEQLPLVGMLEERGHRTGHQVPCRLVAGHDEQQEEEVELELVQLLALHLCVDQDRDQVGLGREPALRGQLLRVAVDLHGRLAGVRVRDLVLGVLGADHAVGPVEDHAAVLLGHAEELGDDEERELGGHLLDEVGRAPLADRVDDPVGVPDDLLFQVAHHLGGEALVDQPAVARVHGRVHVDHHELLLRQLVVVHLVEQRAPPRRGVVLPVAVDVDTVVVAGDGPEAAAGRHLLGVPVDGRLPAQLGEPVVGTPATKLRPSMRSISSRLKDPPFAWSDRPPSRRSVPGLSRSFLERVSVDHRHGPALPTLPPPGRDRARRPDVRISVCRSRRRARGPRSVPVIPLAPAHENAWMDHDAEVPGRVSTGLLPSDIDVRAEVSAGYEQFRSLPDGTMPDYIPALASASPDAFGVCVAGVNGQIFAIGDAEMEFTIQSISKVFVFALVCDTLGPDEARRRARSERLPTAVAVSWPFSPRRPLRALGRLALRRRPPGQERCQRWARHRLSGQGRGGDILAAPRRRREQRARAAHHHFLVRTPRTQPVQLGAPRGSCAAASAGRVGALNGRPAASVMPGPDQRLPSPARTKREPVTVFARARP